MKRIRGKAFSDGHALETDRDGPTLEMAIAGARFVRVIAKRCDRCGRIGIETQGKRRRTIDLGRPHAGSVYKVELPARRRGRRVQLISLGGGRVRIDGFAVLRRP